jgi:hypothetical protein
VKVINVNIIGTPTDTPILRVDVPPGLAVSASLAVPQRATFVLPDDASGGATITYNDGAWVRVLVPAEPGAYEADLPPVRPPEQQGELALVYGPRRGGGADGARRSLLRGRRAVDGEGRDGLPDGGAVAA